MTTINEIEILTSKVNELQKENEELQILRYILCSDYIEPTKEEINKLTKDFKIESLIELKKENEDLKTRIQALRTEPTEEEIDKVIEHYKND